jgi:hypothetical protein
MSKKKQKRHAGWWFQLLWKNMSSSVGMMKFLTKWKNKKMFQTTNQHEY